MKLELHCKIIDVDMFVLEAYICRTLESKHKTPWTTWYATFNLLQHVESETKLVS